MGNYSLKQKMLNAFPGTIVSRGGDGGEVGNEPIGRPLSDGLTTKSGKRMTEMDAHRKFSDIERSFGSPFYLFDQDAFARNFRELRAAFTRHYPDIVIGYSYKTNYIPYVCRMASDLGAHAEVVSRLELDLALRIGCNPEEIIFNGPIKGKDDLELAIRGGMLLNIDTFRELEEVTEFARLNPTTVVNIGLRVNIPLVDDEGKSQLQEHLPTGRFGFSPEALGEAAHQIRSQSNIRVNALHGHTSSSTRSVWVYRTIVRCLSAAAERHFSDTIEYLNLGGGFFGHRVPEMGLCDTPSYGDYAEAVGEELRRHPWVKARRPRLIIEPGMAVVADTMSFVTRVFEVKKIGERRLAVVDGSIFNVKPTLHHRNHPYEVIKGNGASRPRSNYDVVGATCMEKDCLLQNIECEEIERGDFIQICNVGAYTIVLTPPFIHPSPPILIHDGEDHKVIRRRQEFSDVFGTYTF
ncbi:MAG: diaminopimelate decarboxylase [Desulfuromonas sp.]|uniref:hypothetical protein n=1 Tax=Desulfuromonas sp. TaxID=892 RepID=UPI000CC6A367|nr:hypothetical protein [Desulfuromonas sp.]PLX82007.1 MAG: diaminopimelate decarboxylase [Desulfuromonas sp.]